MKTPARVVDLVEIFETPRRATSPRSLGAQAKAERRATPRRFEPTPRVKPAEPRVFPRAVSSDFPPRPESHESPREEESHELPREDESHETPRAEQSHEPPLAEELAEPPCESVPFSGKAFSSPSQASKDSRLLPAPSLHPPPKVHTRKSTGRPAFVAVSAREAERADAARAVLKTPDRKGRLAWRRSPAAAEELKRLIADQAALRSEVLRWG